MPRDVDHLKAQREQREPGIELVRCADGLWRTAEEKVCWDQAAAAQMIEALR
jgi:hypothetical protein